MENKKLTAIEARKIADASDKFINRVYKFIKEESSEWGHTSFNYCVCGTSDVLIEKLIRDLNENGYTTKIHYDVSEWDETKEVPSCVEISW